MVGGRLSAVFRRKPTSECRQARRLDLLDRFRGRDPTSRRVAMGPRGALFLLTGGHDHRWTFVYRTYAFILGFVFNLYLARLRLVCALRLMLISDR